MTTGSTLPRRALGRQLKGLRERNGITQADAARIVEVSPQSYGRLEDGRVTKITNLGINALANASGRRRGTQTTPRSGARDTCIASFGRGLVAGLC
ncbi:helix-turn-helix domain-containing protein [Nocardia sp. NPDC049220]|uniref:helix-turn-helix transcriptional regulator n=1 Tax=Nocardia sp. NPDC049220 TaxID=3155273 RepID=UPI0033C99A46